MHISVVVGPDEESWNEMQGLVGAILKHNRNCQTEVRFDNSGAEHPLPFPFVEVRGAGKNDGCRFGNEAKKLLKSIAST